MATAPDLDMRGDADAHGGHAEPGRIEYPAEFLSWLMQEEARARDAALDDQRAVALSFYNGEPFGDEEEGRSQIVTRDVAEVVDYMVPSVLRTMVSGDRVVEFEALDEGFAELLEQATEAVSQQFMQEQDGWRILHDCLKAGLLEKTGAVKSYFEEKRVRREREVGVEELVLLQMDGTALAEAEPVDPAEQRWRIAWFETEPRFRDMPVPNEELQVAPDARSLDEAVYYVHRTEKTLSDIREMGLDADAIGGQDGGWGDTRLSDARDGDARSTRDAARDGANRKIVFLEEYCRYDLDGDGVTERLRVQRVGTAILSVEAIEYGPCEEWCPFPMPHRRIGQSLADKVMDIQRTRSVLMRQAMDNLYQSNMPRILVHEQSMGDSTIDDLLTVRPNALIRWTGSHKPEPWGIPFVANHAFSAMEVLVGERESRTGITRLNQGLDADTLNKTATGTALMQAQGQQMEEFVARNFAEFVGRVFARKYRLMRDYGRPFRIVVDGRPVDVDPRAWPDRMRVVVRVGLGSGSKDQRLQHRLLLLNLQKEAAMVGDPHVGAEQIFNSVKGIVADLQLGRATAYYADPGQVAAQQAAADGAAEPPDPRMLELQARAQAEERKLAFQAEKAERDTQLKARQQEIDAGLQQQRTAADLQAKREKDALDAHLAQQRADREWSLARLKAEREWELARRRLEREATLAEKGAKAPSGSDALPRNRPGGDLSR